MFIVPCKYDGRPFVQLCVSSIRDFYPTARILVVDSDSDDASYVAEVRAMGADVDRRGNPHYADGAVWKAYDRYPHEDYYALIHDSMQIVRPIDNYIHQPFSSYMWWDSTVHAFDTPEQALWCGKLFKRPEVRLAWEHGTPFLGLCGVSFIASNPTLFSLYSAGVPTFKPVNKSEACGCERAWGIALQELGVDIQKNSIGGDFHNRNKNPAITKRFLNRP